MYTVQVIKCEPWLGLPLPSLLQISSKRGTPVIESHVISKIQ